MKRRDFIKSLPPLAAGGLLACETVTQSTAEDLQGDLDIIQSGAEFEAFGVLTYDAAIASGKVTDPFVADAAQFFRAHHFSHLQALNNLLTQNGRNAVDLSSASPDPRAQAPASQNAALRVALEVEFSAGQFYFSAIRDQLTTAAARNLFADILPIETSHATVIKQVLGLFPAINSALFSGFSSGL